MMLGEDKEIDLLTEDQLASILHVKLKTLQKWRLDGEAPKSQNPRKKIHLYYKQDVIDWLEKGDK